MTRKASKPASRREPVTRRKSSARPDDAISRRSFVTMVAAGSALLLARPGRAQSATGSADASASKSSALSAATQKEFDRQRAGMLSTLKTLREAPLPPGGDLSVVFEPRARKAAPRKAAAAKVAR